MSPRPRMGYCELETKRQKLRGLQVSFKCSLFFFSINHATIRAKVKIMLENRTQGEHYTGPLNPSPTENPPSSLLPFIWRSQKQAKNTKFLSFLKFFKLLNCVTRILLISSIKLSRKFDGVSQCFNLYTHDLVPLLSSPLFHYLISGLTCLRIRLCLFWPSISNCTFFSKSPSNTQQ